MNKSFFLIIIILCTASSVSAQNLMARKYKKFRVGLGVGYAIASGNGSGAGVVGTVEPGFLITDQLLVNVRFEGAMIVRGTDQSNALEIDYATIGSSTINAQYFFSYESLRPFIGAGVGIYQLPEMEFEYFGLPQKTPSENMVGFYPRVGFDVGHFTICIDYNIIPPSKFQDSEFKNNHVGIRLGFHLGGGRLE